MKFAQGAVKCLWLACLLSSLSASPLRFSGQASAWAIGNWGHDPNRFDSGSCPLFIGQGGIRYIPALAIGGKEGFGAEVSANGWVEGSTDFRDSLGGDWKVKPYRAWVRYARPRFDARLGLQRISFGSATLLRPLMWFDRIDPHDPLQLTDGVYALLGRYFLQNNTNFWAWGLLGNDSTKGWETIPTEAWKPELGGRVQVPVPRGELAATYHYRQPYLDIVIPGSSKRYLEHRVALDGKWDVGIGLEFEAVVTSTEPDSSSGQGVMLPRWEHAAMAGADYTIPLGNGLGLLAEHMLFNGTKQVLEFDKLHHMSAASVSYPLGLVDNLRALVYYDWDNKGLYRYLSWQRTMDNWIFNVAAFWNPSHPAGLAGTSAVSTAAGKGLMVMIVFNH